MIYQTPYSLNSLPFNNLQITVSLLGGISLVLIRDMDESTLLVLQLKHQVQLMNLLQISLFTSHQTMQR
jgi:hypothetical protein